MLKLLIKDFRILGIIVLLLLNYIIKAQDSTTINNKIFNSKNIYVGGFGGPVNQVIRKYPGKQNSELYYLQSYSCLFVEYFPLSRFSTFCSYEFDYTYIEDTLNFGAMGGIIGIRYYPYSLRINKKKRKTKYPTFTGYLGLQYGRGYGYKAPNYKNVNDVYESFGINYGVTFHPNKLFKRNNKHFIFEYSTGVPLHKFGRRFPQYFGGFGVKYRLAK